MTKKTARCATFVSIAYGDGDIKSDSMQLGLKINSFLKKDLTFLSTEILKLKHIGQSVVHLSAARENKIYRFGNDGIG